MSNNQGSRVSVSVEGAQGLTPATMRTKRYCGLCDRWVPAREYECKLCGAKTDKGA